MTIAIYDSNDCNFAIRFSDESLKGKVIEYMKAGLEAWYSAAHEDYDDNKYFTKEEIGGFYWAGYAEPTCELLDRDNIKYEILDIEDDMEIDKCINY